MVEWDIIEHNPAEKIKLLRVTETQKFIPLTPAERTTIKEYLIKNHYRFFVYIMCIFYGGIRPKEVLSLKIKDIDFKQQLIKIIPDLESENSKTKTILTRQAVQMQRF